MATKMLANGLKRVVVANQGRVVAGSGFATRLVASRSQQLLTVPFRGLTIDSYPSMADQVKLQKPALPPLPLDGAQWSQMKRDIAYFDASLPIEEASTPPASWYTDPAFLTLEKKAIFDNNWQYACHVDNLKVPGDFYAGSLLGEHFVVVRGEDNKLRAFYNVCRHHATILSPPGCTHHAGRKENFVCCYHGWTYGLDGRLLKATKLKGIKNFSAKDYGLKQIPLSQWGPYVFVWLGEQQTNLPSIDEILKPVDNYITSMNFGDLSELKFVSREVHVVNSNWKIVNDNYLDGEYHIPHVHNGLFSILEMKAYKADLPNRDISLQIASPNKSIANTTSTEVKEGQDFTERIGDRGAVYGLLYPNFAINRYGPMCDTNLVIPLSYDKTAIIFDYFFEEKYVNDKDFVQKSIAASRKVQEEDTSVCELIQEGLTTKGYNTGRYSPTMETPTYHFHRFVADCLQKYVSTK